MSALARFRQHHGVVNIDGYFHDERMIYMQMRYYPNGTLHDFIDRTAALSPVERLQKRLHLFHTLLQADTHMSRARTSVHSQLWSMHSYLSPEHAQSICDRRLRGCTRLD